MAKIVGIKFKYAGKIYYFDPKGETFEEGSGVIVETAKGLEYGTVALPVREVPDKDVVQPLKPIVRKASKKDEENREKFAAKRPEASFSRVNSGRVRRERFSCSENSRSGRSRKPIANPKITRRKTARVKISVMRLTFMSIFLLFFTADQKFKYANGLKVESTR